MTQATAALHVGLLIVATAVTGSLAGYAWRHRDEQAVIPFGLLMTGFVVYSGAHLVGVLTVAPVWRLGWEYLQWTGTALIPVFWLLFAMAYTGYGEMITPQFVAALSVVPVVTIFLVWTNGWHGLMWTRNTVVVVDGLALLEQPFGPWTVVFAGISYSMLAVGSFLLLRLVWLSDRLYTGQALLLVVGIAAPVAANVLTVIGATPIREPPLDLSPYAFSITGLAFGYALFRKRLFDLVPATQQLGREAAIRDLQAGIVIVDTDRRVIYCNPAAADLLDCEATAVLGVPVASLMDGARLDFDTEDALAELTQADRTYEVRTSPIRDRRDRLVGHTLLVRDVTARNRRERRLTRQRDELVRLDRLNAVVRGVNRALISATTRAEIEEAVCDRLAEPALYRAACVADVPTWNGDADRWTIATAGGATADGVAAPPGGEVDLAADAPPEPAVTPDDEAASSETWTVVPLTHGRTVYGALGLQATGDGPDHPVTDRERAVLTELGQLIGQAIRAVETRQLLAAEAVVELEIHSTDADDPLVAASRPDTRLEVTGFVPDAGEGHLAYVHVENGTVGAVVDALTAAAEAETRVIRADESAGTGLIEWSLPAATPLGTLAEHGANVVAATAEDGTATYVVEVASNADVRAILDRVQQTAPDTWLKARRQRERPIESADGVVDETVADLTDRQQEALEAAYRAGYYDWPRDSTAEDVAETLDIAAPTLHAHLRKAEGSLLGALFDRHH